MMPRGRQRHLADGDHWRKYDYSNETPPLALDTVDELEWRLRMRFPEVFEAAKEREYAKSRIQRSF
jgi:hypothetical protein